MFIIKFSAWVGNERINVEISQPLGANDIFYNITIDDYSHGSIIKRNGEWIRLHINNNELTLDDVQILGEMIDKSLNS